MFSSKLKIFNSSISRPINSLSKKEIDDLIQFVEKTVDENKDSFYLALDEKKILKKIDFLLYSVDKKISSIEDFEINKGKIKILFKNQKDWVVGKTKKNDQLIEDYFFIQKNDELFYFLYFYFMIPSNYIAIQLYSYLT